ncbi:MAG: hypothetical protein EZS28_005204 [Streblomastix strix]|uniref:Uncharacterized protein n=1 Tax=Streblomastix strix TaxID=222440 RepID=A0A5J4WW78_9EUKA|nr:MAG: hypothetical protein EZS28_005204 [Streblomastix strix]
MDLIPKKKPPQLDVSGNIIKPSPPHQLPQPPSDEYKDIVYPKLMGVNVVRNILSYRKQLIDLEKSYN